MDAFVFQPEPVERVWGAGEPGPGGLPIGEWWLLSDHPHRRTRVALGAHAGATLEQLMEERGEGFWGNRSPRSRFPILIKRLVPRHTLPLQTHPAEGPDEKNECWYITVPQGRVINGWYGDRRVVAQSLAGPHPDERLRRVVVQQGCLVTIPAGSPHALGRGTEAIEVQDTADVTWRIDLRGHRNWSLPLAVTEAIDAFQAGGAPPRELSGAGRIWRQDAWTVRVHSEGVLMLRTAGPTAVVPGQAVPWQIHDGVACVEVPPGAAVLLLFGTFTLQASQDTEWIVAEVS